MVKIYQTVILEINANVTIISVACSWNKCEAISNNIVVSCTDFGTKFYFHNFIHILGPTHERTKMNELISKNLYYSICYIAVDRRMIYLVEASRIKNISGVDR